MFTDLNHAFSANILIYWTKFWLDFDLDSTFSDLKLNYSLYFDLDANNGENMFLNNVRIVFAFEFNKNSRCSINGWSASFSDHVCWCRMHLWCTLTDMIITVWMNMCDQGIFFVIRWRNLSFWFFDPSIFWLYDCFWKGWLRLWRRWHRDGGNLKLVTELNGVGYQDMPTLGSKLTKWC